MRDTSKLPLKVADLDFGVFGYAVTKDRSDSSRCGFLLSIQEVILVFSSNKGIAAYPYYFYIKGKVIPF